MKTPRPSTASYAAIAATLIMLPALSACSTVSGVNRPEDSDPFARPTQVGWNSARATRCGFIFNPTQLRSNYLAAERAAGRTPAEMREIERAYDYTHESVTGIVNDNPSYCNKERTDAIRVDLNRYLSGDYRAKARMPR